MTVNLCLAAPLNLGMSVYGSQHLLAYRPLRRGRRHEVDTRRVVADLHRAVLRKLQAVQPRGRTAERAEPPLLAERDRVRVRERHARPPGHEAHGNSLHRCWQYHRWPSWPGWCRGQRANSLPRLWMNTQAMVHLTACSTGRACSRPSPRQAAPRAWGSRAAAGG